MAAKQPATWHGVTLLDPKHERDLSLSAAIHEFHEGHDRATAEKMALADYQREHHARAAAHHLNRMRATQGHGAPEEARKHYDAYVSHIKALGHQEHEAVPPEVKQYAEGPGAEGGHVFEAHPADQYLASQKQP